MSTANHAAAPTHDAIAREAHDIFLARDGAPGDPVKDWLDAEAAIRARATVTVTAIPAPSPKASLATTPKPIATTPPAPAERSATANAAAGPAKPTNTGGHKPAKKNRR